MDCCANKGAPRGPTTSNFPCGLKGQVRKLEHCSSFYPNSMDDFPTALIRRQAFCCFVEGNSRIYCPNRTNLTPKSSNIAPDSIPPFRANNSSISEALIPSPKTMGLDIRLEGFQRNFPTEKSKLYRVLLRVVTSICFRTPNVFSVN